MPQSEVPNREMPDDVPELSTRQLSTYARLWQLETWLRRMVYVELRAAHGDQWSSGIQADGPLKADKRLRHMPTPEQDPLSYIGFSRLTQLVADNWNLFDCYLPPQNLWQAKLEEVAQIRNRVAHFRRGHADDHPRVLQLLRDLDAGFWKFCTSYNDRHPVLPASNDPVCMHFLEHDPFPWTRFDDNRWARVGHVPSDMLLSVTIEMLRRPWAARISPVNGARGHLYDVDIVARDHREFDYPDFLKNTATLHPRLAHLCLTNAANAVRLTIPAVLGAKDVIDIIEQALEVAKHTVFRGRRPHFGYATIQELADQWPEFLLGPENPLTFLSPDMACTFFSAEPPSPHYNSASRVS